MILGVLAVALVAAAPVRAVTITEFAGNPKTISSFPVNITSGPEGNLWWTDIEAEPGIVRMSPSGEYLPRISDPNKPVDVVVAPSGWASWVSEKGTGTRSPGGFVSITESSLHGSSIILAPGNHLRWGVAKASARPLSAGRLTTATTSSPKGPATGT